jgi:hypothetical protein
MNIDDFKIEHTFFSSPVKNIVIEGSSFIKLIYSNTLTTLACIYLQVPIHILRVERYFNKLKYSFDYNTFHNKKIIENLYLIENAILEKIAINNKKPVLHLYDKLSRGAVSMNVLSSTTHKRCLFLKISGIWETGYNYGLTFKFV